MGVVMELAQNLMKESRTQLRAEFSAQSFKKVAVVNMGEPNKSFKEYQNPLWLKEKQEILDAEWKKKVEEHGRKKAMKQKQKELEKKKKEDDKKRKKLADEAK